MIDTDWLEGAAFEPLWKMSTAQRFAFLRWAWDRTVADAKEERRKIAEKREEAAVAEEAPK